MRRVTNVAASVRQRLLNEAKRRGETFDYVTSLYARERFLARLAASAHRDRLILKGATLFALWLDAHRPTRDLDFLGLGSFDVPGAVEVIRDVAGVALDDGLTFHSHSVHGETIRVGDEYHGVRVHLTAALDTARARLQIDIGIGDIVTPAARVAELPTLLDEFAPPRVRVYPPETVVAEKLHAMVKLGVANSRMKDFFDVHLLASRFEFEEDVLANAVARTFRRRKTAIPDVPFALTDEFYDDRTKQMQWTAFVRKSGVEAPGDFATVGKRLRKFLLPILESARSGAQSGRRWTSNSWL